jgi:maltose O-acetyltransferase
LPVNDQNISGKKLMLIYNTIRNEKLTLKIEDVPVDWIITTDRRYFGRADAVIFYLPYLYNEVEYDLDKPEEQIWISWCLEAEKDHHMFNDLEIKDVIDIWMSYSKNEEYAAHPVVSLCRMVDEIKLNQNEKRKMLNGEYYNPMDEKLIEERLHVQKLLYQYNRTEEWEDGKRYTILKKLLGSSGESITIMPSFKCEYGKNIYIGEDFYANYDCLMLDVCPIVIGNHCLLGPGVHIYTSTHPVNPAERAMKKLYGKPVTIGNNVWIGGHSVINPGVTIGDNSVIASGSVVVKDIPANVLAGGNPAKVIKKI